MFYRFQGTLVSMKRTVYSRGPWDHEASRRAYDKGRKMILKLRANGSEAESVELDIKCVLN